MSAYKIYDVAPADWKELQQLTATILSECGFNTEIEKSIETVRGTVEVDVYGERKKTLESKIICECKYWQSAVPQTVIHAFRTVIHDSGASQGILFQNQDFKKVLMRQLKNRMFRYCRGMNFRRSLEWNGLSI
jgi:hypothetical protein